MYIPPHIIGQNYEKYKNTKKTLEKKGLPVGGYIRISTRKDSQKTSIENQKKLLEQWAEVSKYKLVRTYIDIKSGEYTYLRNEIQKMFKDIESGRIKGVVSKEITRTSRDIMDIITIKRTLSDYGAFFISIKENYDSRTDDDEFLLILHGGLAQKERKTTSSRVKVTQIMKAKEGKTNVPSPAYGYKLSEDRQHIVVNPETAPFYRQIVEKFLAGWGQLKIAKWLNQRGIYTRRGGQWSTNAIRIILLNPVYLGITIYNTSTLIRDSKGKQKRVIRPREEWIIRENTHEPLLSEDEFNKISIIMQQRREKYRHEWSCDRKYLGSSILRCAACGGKIYGYRKQKSKTNDNKGYLYKYRCIGVNGKCKGKNKYWDMDKIDQKIISIITSIFLDKKKMLFFIRRNMDLFTDDLTNLIEEKNKLNFKLGQINESIKKQQLAYEQDAITIEEYKKRMGDLREDKRILDKKLDKIILRLDNTDVINVKIDTVFNQVNTYLESMYTLPQEEKFHLISSLSNIYIDESGNITDVKFS